MKLHSTSAHRRWLSSALLFALACACLASGCASHRASASPSPAAPTVISNTVRESPPNDYLRVSFLPAGVKVATLSRPGALRAFATATPLYLPPLKVSEFPYYSGLVNDDTKVLVAMRCRPQHPETVDAVLATWPNVFVAIQRDVPLKARACESEPGDTATEMSCFARAFSDPPSTAVPASLAHTFSYAGSLYDGSHPALAQWLQSNYGIYPAFAGSGYSIKDSYSLAGQPMTSEEILAKSISSEYLLNNVSLADAGCRCISVPPYPGRSEDRLDPEFISQAGGYGVCQTVNKLATRHRH